MSTAVTLMLASKPPAALSQKLVTAFTPGPDRADFTGAAGVYFTPNKALTFNKIGLRCGFGTPGSQVVALHTPAGGTPLASATINLAGHAYGDWVYADITPVTLTSGSPYMLRSEVFASSTYWWSDAAAPNAAVLRDCNLDWRSAYGFGINDSDHLGLAYPSMYVGVDLDYVTVVPWKPTDLGSNLVGWFDGADAATITITGSGVSNWTNKGVSTLTLSQAVDARRPSYASNTVTFSRTGAGQHLIGGIIAPNPVAAYDFLIAGKPLQGGVDWRTLVYSTGQHITIEDTSERYGVYNGAMFAIGTWGNVAGLSYGQISNAGPAKLSRDGGALVSSGTTLSTDTSVWGFGSAGSYGGGGVVDQAWGDVYEFFIVPYNSSDDTRQKLEGYSAWKWGLQGLLPSGHPYKAAPP